MSLVLKKIRQHIKQQRLGLDRQFREQASQQIMNTLIQLDAFMQATTLGLYFDAHGEVMTQAIWMHACQQKKTCYFPVLDMVPSPKLTFYSASPGDDLHTNVYHIPEPDVSSAMKIDHGDLDVVLAPLVAFDTRCYRLGMGAGFYDRSFAFLTNPEVTKPVFIGLAYEMQKINDLPVQAWDIPLAMVITEQQIYRGGATS